MAETVRRIRNGETSTGWIVAIALAGVIFGGGATGAVGHYQYTRLEAAMNKVVDKIDERNKEDNAFKGEVRERLSAIETSVNLYHVAAPGKKETP